MRYEQGELFEDAGALHPDHPDPPVLEHREAPTELLIEAKEYIARSEVIYAKSMPFNPHWYLVRGRPRKEPGHEALYELIRDFHRSRKWGRHWWATYDLDGWSWWVCDGGKIINTKPLSHAGWQGQERPPKDWLPDSFRRNLDASARNQLRHYLGGKP